MDHGFTAVDRQPDPEAWAGCLDTLHREPFYRQYKSRVAELLEPRSGGRYLDVGAGTGEDARAIAAGAECIVVAVDRSLTMAAECRRRGGVMAVVGEAKYLPFGDDTFDGCWADRTFQHLSDPTRALSEMVRVVRGGGRVIIVDPDYDTQVMELADQELARRVLRFRADSLLRNGTMAHRMPAMFADAGLDDVRVEAMTLVVRDPTAVDNVMGLRGWAHVAHDAGRLTAEDVRRWLELYDQSIAAGTFFYALTFFITCGTKGM